MKRNSETRHLSISEFGKHRNTVVGEWGGAEREQAGRGWDPFRPTSKNPPFSLSSPPLASFVGHPRESIEDADKVICKEGHSKTGSGYSWYVFRTGPLTSRSHPSNSSGLCFASSGSKRPRDSQEDTPEPKRRRIARNRTLRAPSETEAPQSSSGSSASFEGDSELAALRRTLQQVQEDLSALQKDQRQLDDITRGIQHDLDKAQPYNTLRFLEEHFTCAL